MKALVLFSSYFFSVLLLATQTQRVDSVISESEMAEKLKFYQNIVTLHSAFKQLKKLKDLGVELRSEGELSLTRPNKVIWKVLKPAPTLLTLDGAKVSMESGSGADKKINTMVVGKDTDAAVSKSLVDMVAWLKIDVPAIYKAYAVRRTAPNVYRCEPRDKESALFLGLSFFVHPKGHLEKLFIEEKSGDTIEIRFATPSVTYQK